jgi:serine/threonine-protein kinase
MAANSTLRQANRLGRYEILRELGRGAIGVVYAARDKSTGAAVALKSCDAALLNLPKANFSDLFLKEVRAAWRLKHRNIVNIHDAGEASGTGYVAMELLEGETLRKVLDAGPLSIARAIKIADEIASGLAYAHEQGVVHRGVKPSNIIVLRAGGVRICDFGFGLLAEEAMLSGQREGCLSCMSPEQVGGDPVDARSDIFALGAVFYEMLARRPAFPGDSPHEIMQKIVHAEPPPPSDANPHVPRALDRIVLGMLVKRPDDRLPGAQIVLRELQRLRHELGLGEQMQAANRLAPHDSAQPAALQPPRDHEPRLRTPDAGRVRGVAPTDHGPRLRDREAFDQRDDMLLMDHEPEFERSFASRSGVFAWAALVLAVLAIGLAVFLHYSPEPAGRRITALLQQATGTAPAPPPPSPPQRASETANGAAAQPPAPPPAPQPRAAEPPAPPPPAPEPLPTAPSPTPQAESSVAAAAEPAAAKPSAAAGTTRTQEAPPATKPSAKSAEPKAGGMARLIIAVSPRGEIYIDDKHYGTTPPITTLDLEPGVHRIEVRSGSQKPYLTYMTLQAGEVRRIRHEFGAPPSGPQR